MERTEHRTATRSGKRTWIEADGPARPKDVHEARAMLDAVTEALLARGDPRAAFADVYAIITRRVAESVALGAGPLFVEPAWISRLASRFCARYLATLRWSLAGDAQDTGAWRIAYDCCDSSALAPLHHVLLGLSAHINDDLALGIAATIEEHGGASDPARMARYKHDHDAVNCLLRASIPEAFDHLIGRHGCPVTEVLYRRAYGLSEMIAMHVLTSWRDRVWNDAVALLRAPTPAARQRVERRLSRRANRYARILALPGAIPLPREAPGRRPGGAVTLQAERWLSALG